LPESIGNLINLKTLNIENNKLISLPESIGNLITLNTLNLNCNKLASLPKSIGNLNNLKTLNIEKNELVSIPKSIGNLTNLNTLNLWGNRLTNLPESIGRLNSLIELRLRANRLTSLPESIGNLTSLKKLNLGGNQLVSLPESIGNLTNLNDLNLGVNKLVSLPESIGNLTNLNTLNLKENKLIRLPKSFANFTTLSKIFLKRNLLEEPPLEIAEQGIDAIRKYFKQLEKEGQDYIYEAKLLIVGEGEAGKTTLAKKIQNPNYQLQDEDSTQGIDIIKWSFPLQEKEERKRDFTVNIWDFGGQEIYHATHQFFLTKRSLYSLVADTRKEDTDFYYWLNIVEILSDNSPLLIVKNEKQDRKREINDRALRGQFINLEKILATNLATNRGLDEIIENMKFYIQNLPLVGQALPKTWVKVRRALEQDHRNYISLQDYLDICENNGFKNIEDKLQLSGYLHDLGVCLHFQDQENSLLYKTVILKPTWGTDAVYKILDNPQVCDNQGHFTCDDLKNIWHEECYSAMRGELLELMKKFQLCYEIPEEKNSFIAPQLLSENQPEYNWNDETNNLILRYAYPDFMPKGIVTRFIVIMHQYIENQEYVWKSGVILSKDNARAEIIENYGKREIKIRVSGNNRKSLLIIITHEIDKINDSYKRLKYQKLIPCNCSACKNTQSPHFYDFQILRKFLADGQKAIQCQKSYEMVDVLSLIDDVELRQKSVQDDEPIKFNREQEYIDIIKKQANRPIQNIINNKNQLGDNEMGDRKISINQGNYNENIQGDYVQGNKTSDGRSVNITGGNVDISGAGALNLGTISGTVANTINQLPASDSDQPGIKELLTQLKEAIETSSDLDDEDKNDALEEVNNLAEASQDNDDEAKKNKAGQSLKMLRRIAKVLPPAAAFMTISKEVLPAISNFFGL
ncbi:MAG: COR domain-containing protein, partial [Cyanobacteria bacterium P01_F01_bin.143]